MQSKLTDVQRLDFVARSYMGGVNAELSRWVLTGLTFFFVCLALMSGSPPHEILLVRLMAVVAVAAVLMSWLDKRFVGYAWAATCATATIGVFLSHDYSQTEAGWMVRVSSACFLVYMGSFWWKRAWQATVVRRESWSKEREQVEKWIGLLENPSAPAILQFSSESFGLATLLTGC